MKNLMPKNRVTKRHKGFTIIEVVVVTALIGLLAAIIIPVLHNQLTIARERVCRTKMDQIRQALLRYAQDVGFRPAAPGAPTSDEIALGAFPPAEAAAAPFSAILPELLVSKPADSEIPDWDPAKEEGWNGPYIDPGLTLEIDADGDGVLDQTGEWRVDPWNRYFIYFNLVLSDPYVRRLVGIYSVGPDRLYETADDLYVKVYEGEVF